MFKIFWLFSSFIILYKLYNLKFFLEKMSIEKTWKLNTRILINWYWNHKIKKIYKKCFFFFLNVNLDLKYWQNLIFKRRNLPILVILLYSRNIFLGDLKLILCLCILLFFIKVGTKWRFKMYAIAYLFHEPITEDTKEFSIC